MRYKWVTHALLAMAICAMTARGASAALIFSDNFNGENGGAGALNYAAFTNFSVSSGSVDLIGNGYFDFLPGNGLYVDLDGSTSNAGILTESAAIPLAAGAYKLSFDIAGNRRGGLEDVTVNVFGSLSSSYGSLVLLNIPTFAAFSNKFISFSLGAFDPSVQFSFSNAGGDNVGALLDNIRLDSVPVPEPMTLALLGSGMVGLVVRRRRATACGQ